MGQTFLSSYRGKEVETEFLVLRTSLLMLDSGSRDKWCFVLLSFRRNFCPMKTVVEISHCTVRFWKKVGQSCGVPLGVFSPEMTLHNLKCKNPCKQQKYDCHIQVE